MTVGKRLIGFFSLCLASLHTPAQDSARLSLAAYGELYYGYDFSRPPAHTRPAFVYSHNRTQEVAVNLALLRVAYTRHRMRANLGFMAGTYSNANLAAEPGVLKNLFEANAGIRVTPSREVWIDVGVMSSHIGFESAIGKDSWTLTRSVAADNSPYYETGVRLSYSSPNQKWYTALLFLNGWQRIQRPDGNSTPAAGSQVTFKPSEKLLINSSTFVGNDKPDSTRRMRYFHNLYGSVQISERAGITIGFDAGMEQKHKRSSSMNCWYTPVLILRTRVAAGKFIAARAEYYKDENGVIISGMNGTPFSVWGYSANLDWALTPNLLWRLEAKGLNSRPPYFLNDQGIAEKYNWVATTALCFSF